MKFNSATRATALALVMTGVSSVLSLSAVSASASTPNPSIFIRYQYEVSEILALLKAAEGKPLAAGSVEALWLDEMGWRKWVKEYSAKPFQLTAQIEAQLKAQDKFLRNTYSYQVGDVVWTPAEAGEQPYGHNNAKVNPRGKIINILKGEVETYFVVEVAIDNGANGGMRTIQGKLYNGSTGPVLDYGDAFAMEKKTYVYSLAEIERDNAPFRSQAVGSDTGATVDYTKDAKWLAKLDAFKDKVVAEGLEVDYLKSEKQVYEAQRVLIKKMFNHFKMNRNAPSGAPMLGDVAGGGGVCFTQACVLSHGVHAVGEPYGIRAMNINGATINPSGGHGFVRITIKGPEEVHVYDLVKDQSGKVRYKGIEIKANTMNYISDPGWADYGTTPEQFAMMPVEEAINPIPIDANRALHELIQGKSFEEVVAKYGNKGAMVGNHAELKSDLFSGSRSIEFLAPKGQISEAASLEKTLGAELSSMVDQAKTVKAQVLALKNGSARGIKSRILAEVVESNVSKLKVPGLSADGLKILLTEYLFRAVK